MVIVYKELRLTAIPLRFMVVAGGLGNGLRKVMAKMSEDKEREFQELSSYLNFFATTVWGIPEDDARHPSHYLLPVPGKVSKSMLLAGLRQAVNDTIEATQDFRPEQVGTFDAACRKRLVLTLSEVRSRYWREYKKIIDRRRIYNDTDYHLAVGVLNDMAATINPIERELLQSLVSAYEEHLRQTNSFK